MWCPLLAGEGGKEQDQLELADSASLVQTVDSCGIELEPLDFVADCRGSPGGVVVCSSTRSNVAELYLDFLFRTTSRLHER